MSETPWWAIYGHFKPWRECPTRPDPGEVLLFYLEKNEIGLEEQVSYLSHLLDLQKSMVYNVLNGLGLDSISRCRILVQALKIPPPLLGLDWKYFPIERHACWWRQFGFSFHADTQGYPVMSEVVAYLRLQMTKIEDGEKVKVWTQEDLGDATGLKKETVYRMEHDHNPFVLESMSRRAVVALALSALAEDHDGTILRLFGLDPEAYGVSVPTSAPTPEMLFLPERLTDEILQDYQQKLVTFFAEYATRHGQHLAEEAHACLRQLEALHHLAKTAEQCVRLLALQCRFHEWLGALACEQMNVEDIADHTDIAVELAEEARDLARQQLGEQEFRVLTSEVLAAALVFRADASYAFDDYLKAVDDIDRALHLLPSLKSIQLKVYICALAGLIHAHMASSEVDQALVLSYFHQAAQLYGPYQLRLASDSPDEHFIPVDTGLLYQYRAMAFCTPNMKGSVSDAVLDLLEEAQRLTPPELRRRHVQILVGLAQASVAAGDCRQALEVAHDALEKSRAIRSRLNRDRLEDLYELLLDTDYRGQPSLVYLGVKLHTWDYGRD